MAEAYPTAEAHSNGTSSPVAVLDDTNTPTTATCTPGSPETVGSLAGCVDAAPRLLIDDVPLAVPEHIQDKPDEIRKRNIYVSGLPVDFGEEHFVELLGQFGKVLVFRFINRNRRVSRAKRAYGFALYEEPAAAEAAVNFLSGFEIEGVTLSARFAVSGIVKPPGSPSSPGPGASENDSTSQLPSRAVTPGATLHQAFYPPQYPHYAVPPHGVFQPPPPAAAHGSLTGESISPMSIKVGLTPTPGHHSPGQNSRPAASQPSFQSVRQGPPPMAGGLYATSTVLTGPSYPSSAYQSGTQTPSQGILPQFGVPPAIYMPFAPPPPAARSLASTPPAAAQPDAPSPVTVSPAPNTALDTSPWAFFPNGTLPVQPNTAHPAAVPVGGSWGVAPGMQDSATSPTLHVGDKMGYGSEPMTFNTGSGGF